MPKLWSETIDAHRREVRDAILDTTTALVHEHGLLEVTMSQIAEQTGIGRATLYKYFPHVEAILLAWHEREVARHLAQLAEIADGSGEPGERLAGLLGTYAQIMRRSQGHGDVELAAFLHRDKHVRAAERRLHDLIRRVVVEAAKAGHARDDVAPEELANYCIHALAAARRARSTTALRRLVEVTLAGLRPET